MLNAVARLGGALRKSGASVSVAEMEVALRALGALEADGLADRETVRRALRQTLVKRQSDVETFDALFNAIFAGEPFTDSAELLEALAAAIGPEAAADLLAALAGEAPEVVPLLSTADGAAAAAEAIAAATANLRSSLQLGAAAYRAASALGLDRATETFARLARERLPEAEAEIAAALFARHAGEIRALLRELAASALTVNQPAERREALAASLSSRPFAGLTPHEIDQLSGEVRRLARRLIASVTRRRAALRHGRLDVARTLRRSMATDAVPFVPIFRRRRPRRPKLVILCDISDSVRNVSRFMLQLVYTMSRLFDGVRSFAFVDDLGELTSLFRHNSIDSAVELAASGAVVNVLANSNYGRALEQLTARHLSVITRRSTVIVIGDGRSNYHDPGLRHLAAIRARAERVWWMNPEPEPVWGFGDSVMHDYRELCDHVAVVGNLSSLEHVVDELLA